MNNIIKSLVAAALLAGALAANAAEAKKPKAVKPYPMDTCVVSGEKLGGMGEPVSFDYEGREIILCCKSCRKDFDKEPKKFVAKVDEAAKQVKAYPLKTCIMSGEPLPEDAPAVVYQKQEFKFCCKDCKKNFAKDPAKNAAKLPKAKS
jgi:YHS domain-containing protein